MSDWSWFPLRCLVLVHPRVCARDLRLLLTYSPVTSTARSAPVRTMYIHTLQYVAVLFAARPAVIHTALWLFFFLFGYTAFPGCADVSELGHDETLLGAALRMVV